MLWLDEENTINIAETILHIKARIDLPPCLFSEKKPAAPKANQPTTRGTNTKISNETDDKNCSQLNFSPDTIREPRLVIGLIKFISEIPAIEAPIPIAPHFLPKRSGIENPIITNVTSPHKDTADLRV
jgi:hypothetical protein